MRAIHIDSYTQQVLEIDVLPAAVQQTACDLLHCERVKIIHAPPLGYMYVNESSWCAEPRTGFTVPSMPRSVLEAGLLVGPYDNDGRETATTVTLKKVIAVVKWENYE